MIADWLNNLLTQVLGTYVLKGGKGTPLEQYTEGGLDIVKNILGTNKPKLVSPIKDYGFPEEEMPTATPTPTAMPTATPTPTAMPTATPTPTPPKPTPTLVPGAPVNPYMGVIKEYFPEEEWNRASNVMWGESNFDPLWVYINDLKERRRVETAAALQNLINQYGSVDVGLYQHNLGTPTGEALLEYMSGLGFTLQDLLDPAINTQLAASRWRGDIPDILGGWEQWKTPYSTD